MAQKSIDGVGENNRLTFSVSGKKTSRTYAYHVLKTGIIMLCTIHTYHVKKSLLILYHV